MGVGELLTIEHFEEIYNSTYYDVLKFVICKYYNMNDINNIVQETYIELYKILSKKSLENTNIKEYIFQIANYKIKKHLKLIARLKSLSLSNKNKFDDELINMIDAEIDIEGLIINRSQCNEIWDYLLTKQVMISKIFFLYYGMDLTIKEIAIELQVNESYVKNCLYRTIKELRKKFKGVKENEI
ncbi:MAG: RNA polymerase sigma factor [Coprobacillaceae bacterium]